MNKSKELISFIIPVFNESSNLGWWHKELSEYLANQLRINFEIIYVNDGSNDDSLDLIKLIAKTDKTVRYINFSRNFGKEVATTAGMHASNGDAVIMIDADGQHPKKLIPTLIEKWEEGYQVVVGVRISNQKEGFIKKYGSKFFYKVLNSITEDNTIPGSTDFRLIDRKVVNEFNKLSERNRITRGLIDWLGFKRTHVEFSSPARVGGRANYNYRKLIRLALHALVSQSTKPLQITGVIGVLVMSFSALAMLLMCVEQVLLRDPLGLNFTGTGFLGVFISFLVGIVLACQGLLALYIESIHTESLDRPLYVIEERNFN